MSRGTIAFLLHAHLPFVRHPAHDDFLEERWLAEAITETYIPLLELLDALDRDGVAARFTISLSPPLLGMLADPLLRARYLRHLDRLVELAEKEERRTRADPRFHRVAEMYLARFYRARTVFLDEWQQDIVAAFRSYQERGLVDVITCAATHGFLPLLAVTPGAVRAQIEVAVAEYRRFFGRGPDGFWLPECAYEPASTSSSRGSACAGSWSTPTASRTRRPGPCTACTRRSRANRGLPRFGRAIPTARSRSGAPRRAIPATSGIAISTATSASISTTTTSDPTCPRPASAAHRPQVPPHHGQNGRERALRARARTRARRGACGAFRRGPRAPGRVARTLDGPSTDRRVPVRRRALRPLVVRGPGLARPRAPPARRVPVLAPGTARRRPRSASDGAARDAGRVQLGLEGIQRDLARKAERLDLPPTCTRPATGCTASACATRAPTSATRRALTQALRELFLAQASDWAFMMARETTAEYATRRTTDHLLRCAELCTQVEHGAIDDLRLGRSRTRTTSSPTLDYRTFV
jgi:1,4-alpha-glucan branching enzyme